MVVTSMGVRNLSSSDSHIWAELPYVRATAVFLIQNLSKCTPGPANQNANLHVTPLVSLPVPRDGVKLQPANQWQCPRSKTVLLRH